METIDTKQLGQEIRSLRKKNKLSQQKLAEMMGVGIQTVWRLENSKGKVHINTLKVLSNIFNIDIKYLMAKCNMVVIKDTNNVTILKNKIDELNEDQVKALLSFINSIK